MSFQIGKSEYAKEKNMATPYATAEQIVPVKSEHADRAEAGLNDELMSADDAGKILYELKIRQSALEAQNEELRETVLQLETSRAMYFDLYDFSPVGYLTINDQGAIIEANLTAANLLDVERDSLLKQYLLRYIDPADLPDFNDYLKQIKETGVRRDWQTRMMRSDGCSFWALLEANTVWKGEYRLVISDITAHKKTEQELQDTNQLFDLFLRNSPVYTYIKEVTSSGIRVLRASDNIAQLTGITASEMTGKLMNELFPAEFAEKIIQDDLAVVSSGHDLKIDENYNGRNYATIKFPIVTESKSLLAGYTIDTTERCKAEEERLNLERQLLSVHKMESLGRMSTGIAHDFNNLLQAVLGNLELALMKFNDSEKVCKHIAQAAKAAEDAARLSGLMLSYSGKGPFVSKELNLNELVNEYSKLLGAAISGSVTFEIKLAETLPPIKADPGQIQQILLSLVANSSEAIGDDKGTITLTTGVNHFDQATLNSCSLEDKLPSGRYVWVEVCDSGCGMDEETLSKMFDPFFSTKFTGRGLSMSATQGIIRAHSGGILVESRPGFGTRIRILFPIARIQQVATNQSPPEKIEGGSAPAVFTKNSKVVLLNDNDEVPRKVIITMLEELGFEELVAYEGSELLKIFSEQSEKISMVLVNKGLLQADGVHLIQQLRKIRADVKILLASGYSEAEISERFKGLGVDGFMQKPFSMEHLKNELQRIFNE